MKTHGEKSPYCPRAPRSVGLAFLLVLCVHGQSPGAVPFLRGDANTDGKVDLADAAYLLNYAFVSFVPPDCFCAGDADGDGARLPDRDSYTIVKYLFLGMDPPFPPFPDPGLDPDCECDAYSPAPPPKLADLSLGFEPVPDVQGPPGSSVAVDVFAALTTAASTIPRGPEGWSIGIAVEGASVSSGLNLDGIAVSGIYTSNGEVQDPYSFQLSHSTFMVIQPANFPGDPSTKGLVAGTIIKKAMSGSFVLHPEGTERIARIPLEVQVPATGCATVTLRYIDGLQGSGQPVANLVSINGTAQTPSLGTCAFQVCATSGGRIIPGDANGDGVRDISDAVNTLTILFLGGDKVFPCGDGSATNPANVKLIDWQPDGTIDLSDAVAILSFLFTGGKAHPLAPEIDAKGCVRIVGCSDSCRQ